MTELSLDFVLDTLEQQRQRATYGAVARLLGKTPRTLMRGRERGPRHSWVVNRSNGLPTGYDESLQHPDLALNAHVIDSREELEAWLSSSTPASDVAASAAPERAVRATSNPANRRSE